MTWLFFCSLWTAWLFLLCCYCLIVSYVAKSFCYTEEKIPHTVADQIFGRWWGHRDVRIGQVKKLIWFFFTMLSACKIYLQTFAQSCASWNNVLLKFCEGRSLRAVRMWPWLHDTGSLGCFVQISFGVFCLHHVYFFLSSKHTDKLGRHTCSSYWLAAHRVEHHFRYSHQSKLCMWSQAWTLMSPSQEPRWLAVNFHGYMFTIPCAVRPNHQCIGECWQPKLWSRTK